MNSRKNTLSYDGIEQVSRRTFVKGLAIGGAAAGIGWWDSAWVQTPPRQQPVLTGTEFDLKIGEQPVNFTGSPKVAHTINGSLPAPTLRWKEGDTVTLRVSNLLK